MIKFLQLFLSLTILITLHEFGHFYFAKKFKTRVDKFYLFFDFLFPFAGLMNFSLFKKKIGETEYGIGWFPLGGYVQIAGMVDEQMDKDIIESEPQPWELRSKPAWQRLLVMMGGILVNFILGIFIYWMVMFFWGRESLPISKLKYGIAFDSVGLSMGLKNGDYIVSMDNKPVNSLNKVPIELIMNKAQSIEVKRDGNLVSVPVSEDNISVILRNLKHNDFVTVRTPSEVDSVVPDMPAAKAGIMKGDFIFGVNGKPAPFYDELRREILLQKGKDIELNVLRGRDTLNLKTQVTADGTVGFFRNYEKYLTIEEQKFGFFQALGEGFKFGMENIVMQVKQFVVLFTVKDAHKQVGGFYSMYKAMPEKWSWERFWLFTAFLSLVLAFMNFLPIPMLDGGYILFILVEMITRRKVPEKVIYYANYVGLFIILGLMIYANTDFLRE
jgi:regulator of sigma E protease